MLLIKRKPVVFEWSQNFTEERIQCFWGRVFGCNLKRYSNSCKEEYHWLRKGFFVWNFVLYILSDCILLVTVLWSALTHVVAPLGVTWYHRSLHSYTVHIPFFQVGFICLVFGAKDSRAFSLIRICWLEF